MRYATVLISYSDCGPRRVAAANALAGVALENSTRTWPNPVDKATAVAEHYVKIAEAFLLEDETVDAENYVNKAMVSNS